MPFDWDSDAMFKACAEYLAKGLRIIRLEGIDSDGFCTCGDPEHRVGGSGERSCGKHPVGKNWKDSYAKSEDDILAWIEDGTPFNVGVLLGPEGGYIDSEDDTPQARAYRESIGMHLLETPTWTSGKSTHQLTLWDDCLSGCKGKQEPGGLEVRIGAGKSIQSVLPPSWHYSGVQYQWKPGMGLDEVDVAPTPKSLLVALVNGAGDSSKSLVPGQSTGALIHRTVHDGEGRHRSLLMWTWTKIVNLRNPLDERQRSILTKEIEDDNEKYLVPPKTKKEVLTIVNSCLEHYRKKRESGWRPGDDDASEKAVEDETKLISEQGKAAVPVGGGYEVHGLVRRRVGTVDAWEPGNWSIQMVHGDPPEIILCVPQWESTPCHGRIQMTFDTFRSANKVAAAVFSATRRVILDGDAGKWASAWKGVDASKKTGGMSVPGLMEQLVSRKTEEDDIYVGTSSLRYAQLCQFVLNVFAKATKPRDEDKPEPNESGRPCWVTPDKLWFQWGKVWDEIGRTQDVLPGERNRIRQKLLDLLGAKDFVHERHRFATRRMEYVVFDAGWMGALEKLAAGEDCPQDADLESAVVVRT